MGFKATNNAKDEEAFAQSSISTFFEFKFDLHKNL